MPPVFITICAIFMLSSGARAQYFSLGQEPASTRWKQIDTENFRLIFPETYRPNALYLASGLEYAYKPLGYTMDSYPGKMPVIIHNNTTYSNAVVPYAPKRMEFLTTTPQDHFSQDWMDQLILHELRHSVQYNQVRQGFTKALSYVFGQQAVPLVYGLFAPFWFIEGDAVITETVLSPSGRGRDPRFEMRMKAQFVDKGIYNYDKALHGSFRDFTPNVYELGYHLMSQTQRDYGRFIWKSVLQRVGRMPFTLVPFSHGIYKETGMGKVKLYRKLTGELKSEWDQKVDIVEVSDHKNIETDSKTYTDYRNPVFIGNRKVAMLKTSLDDIPRIVVLDIDSGEEEILLTPGNRLFTETLTGNGNSLWWSERIQDVRWDLRDYAVVRSFDLETGKTVTHTSKTKYFGPAVSPGGNYVAVVKVTGAYRHYLEILDPEKDTLVAAMQFPGNEMILTPGWSRDGNRIAVITIGAGGKAIVLVDFPSLEHRFITEPDFTEIYNPSIHGDHILFSGAYNGKADIYAVNTLTGNIRRLTSVRYGAYTPVVSPDGEKLVFSNYTADGYRLAVMDIDDALNLPVDRERNYSLNLYRAFDGQQDFVYDSRDVPVEDHEIKNYSKGLNLFNFHSWGPVSIDAGNQDVKPGIQLVSQNLLSSSFATLGWEYDLNEEAGRYYLDYTYEGLYPALDLTADYTTRKQDVVVEGNNYEVKWFETGIKPRVRLPLDLTSGRWYRSLQPSLGVTYSNVKMAKGMPVEFNFENILSVDYRLYYAQTVRSSYRDLIPRWGQVAVLTYRQTAVAGENFGYGRGLAGEGIFYIPGILKHHGFRIYGSYQERSGEVIFSNMISLPRGISGITTDKIISAKADYVFPIFYPDWRLGPVAYFKRFKARLFYDIAFYGEAFMDTAVSAGMDLTTDVHLFSLLAPFEFGIRGIYLPDTQEFQLTPLVSFNIGSIY